MKKFITASLLPLGALLAFGAPAQASPSQSDSSQDQSAAATINQLKARGVDVRVNRIGNGPMDHCTIANISRITTTPPTIPAFGWNDVNVFTQFPQPKATVTLNCTK